MAKDSFLGFERANGQYGIRNHIGVISIMDNVNPITRAVCENVRGTVPITTLFVRGQYGNDLEVSYRTLSGMGRNPNIAGCVFIGMEPTSTGEVADRVRNTGKPVETVCVQQHGGTINATAEATRIAARMATDASKQRRVEAPVSELVLGLECGGSDTTSGLASNPTLGRCADRVIEQGGTCVVTETAEFFGAEHIFAERAVDERVKKEFLRMVLEREAQAMTFGVDIRGANPVPDNIAGGLTTIEEKALGAMAKAGTTPLVDVLEYAEEPTKKGLHFMEGAAPAVESLTGLAGGGIQMTIFTTGVGNTIGNMLMPTAKISGNVNTVRDFPDNIDFDCTGILEQDVKVADMGDRLYDYMLDICSGTMVSSEVLKQQETAITRYGYTI
jgi:altronate dehydratase large subunit